MIPVVRPVRIYRLNCSPLSGADEIITVWTLDDSPLPYDANHIVWKWDHILIFNPTVDLHSGVFECSKKRYQFLFPDTSNIDRDRKALMKTINWIVFISLTGSGSVCLLLTIVGILLRRVVRSCVHTVQKLELASSVDKSFNATFDEFMLEPADEQLEQMIQFAFMALVK
jgi:hypothetical protein